MPQKRWKRWSPATSVRAERRANALFAFARTMMAVLDDLMITATPMGLYVVVNGAVKHGTTSAICANSCPMKSPSTIWKTVHCWRSGA
jgi:hypothetical protein